MATQISKAERSKSPDKISGTSSDILNHHQKDEGYIPHFPVSHIPYSVLDLEDDTKKLIKVLDDGGCTKKHMFGVG